MKTETRHFLLSTIFFILFVLSSIAQKSVDEHIYISKEYSNCSCSWSIWMDSDNPNDGVETETYQELRRHGYQFCEKPVDIQCYDKSTEKLLETDVTDVATTCSIESGLTCNLFCNDYKIRVACCYCPPRSIGPLFQIKSQTSGCLAVGNSSEVRISESCSDGRPGEQWSWVSAYLLKNEMKQQCISIDKTTPGAAVITTNCDKTDRNQQWFYDKITNSLSALSGYLSSVDGSYTEVHTESQWWGEVGIGKIDINILQNFPCDPPPSAPAHGSVSCSLGSYQGSQCHFSCDYGYTLPPTARYPIICMKNGRYNGTSPTCQEIKCNPPLTRHPHGGVRCTNFNLLDSSCLFECEEGYKLETSKKQSICLEDGKWDNYPPPTCTQITCSSDVVEESLPEGLVNCSNRNFYRSICSYSCSQGYELTKKTSLLCTIVGTWNDTKPSCQKIQCPVLSLPPEVEMKCSDNRKFMSSCSFKCVSGHTLVGSDSAFCNSNGMWGSPVPQCQRITCNHLSTPAHGSFSCTDSTYFSSQCSFQCVEGYRLVGEGSLSCTGEGWDHGSPECSQITCPRLQSPVGAEMTCSNSNIFNSQCSFACPQGYDVKGSKVIACEESGWNSSLPTCEKRLCLPPLLHPRNGSVVCNPRNEYGAWCWFRCDEGFAKSSDNPVTCNEAGQWSGLSPTCNRIKCLKLRNLRKGSINCTDRNNYNSKCTFKCRDGFNLYGASQAVCRESGWDAQTPTCDRVVCHPSLSQPLNGQMKCTTVGRITCVFSCNSGFRLKGINTTYCQSDESWTSDVVPTCQRLRCSAKLHQPSHSTMTCSDSDLFGSVCKFTCDKGYFIDGEPLVTCTDKGTWDIPSPTCKRISCVKSPDFNHGSVSCTEGAFYGSVCTFSCGEGYQLIGSPARSCQMNEEWDDRMPYCERITCSPGFSNPSNGRVMCSDHNNLQSVCSFSCDEGFNLVGDSQTTCGAEAWTVTTAPSCKKITCVDEEGLLEHGSGSCDRSNEYQSLCQYKCDEGYDMIGSETRQCGDDGEWTNQKPRCEKIKCPPIPLIDNLAMKCPPQLRYTAECTFECEEGFRRMGANKVQCSKDKTWQPQPPRCELLPTTPTTINTTINPSTPSSVTIDYASNRISINSSTLTTKTRTTSPTISPPALKPQPNDFIGVTTSTRKGDTDPQPTGEGVPVTPIIGAVVGLVVIIIITVVLYVLWKKRNRKSGSRKGIPMQEHRYDGSQRQKLLPNGNSSRKFAPIPLDRLESEFSRKHADDDKLFRDEFSSLPDGQGSRESGGKVINKDRNRYTNIIPFDHSRVILPKSNNSDSDYINASFIDGYKHKGKFIAAQGPKESTVGDFWRMIWDQNVSTIIMVTNLYEGKESKCAQYWPQSGSEVYGDLSVVFSGENHLVDYTIRKFTVQQVRGDATLSMRRNLMHYHFTSWPDFGVPKTPSGMLKFLRKIKHGSPTGYGAIVVHCSAGVGRTGTFICIDAMVDMMMRENKIDVFGFVSQMRSQRSEMVQTEQQYIFIYQALLEHHLYGDTEVEATDMSVHIDELNQRMPGNVTGMEHEFKKLTTIRIQKEQMRAGNHPANMRKNRVLLILPYDWNRVILPVKRGVENSDYINASYIDGYRQKDAYIATQGPLPHTVEDFWRLIWESKSASIVMLTELVERNQAKCEQYWPDNGAMIYGDLTVDNLSEHEFDNYTTRDFVITSTSEPSDRKQMVRQFHYHGWPESGPPVSGFSMITLVEQVQKQQQTSGNHPITIHCSAGAGRTGAFCALSTALEQVKAEGVLDMFQIVKCLRMQRPHMVQNMEQYEFCYRAVQEYIDSMSEYYNFK